MLKQSPEINMKSKKREAGKKRRTDYLRARSSRNLRRIKSRAFREFKMMMKRILLFKNSTRRNKKFSVLSRKNDLPHLFMPSIINCQKIIKMKKLGQIFLIAFIIIKQSSMSFVFKPSWQNEGVGAKVIRIIGCPELRRLDPFLMLDYFHVKLPAGFPDHPHRGF